MAFKSEEDKKNYWRDNLKLMLSLLAVWFVVSPHCLCSSV